VTGIDATPGWNQVHSHFFPMVVEHPSVPAILYPILNQPPPTIASLSITRHPTRRRLQRTDAQLFFPIRWKATMLSDSPHLPWGIFSHSFVQSTPVSPPLSVFNRSPPPPTFFLFLRGCPDVFFFAFFHPGRHSSPPRFAPPPPPFSLDWTNPSLWSRASSTL